MVSPAIPHMAIMIPQDADDSHHSLDFGMKSPPSRRQIYPSQYPYLPSISHKQIKRYFFSRPVETTISDEPRDICLLYMVTRSSLCHHMGIQRSQAVLSLSREHIPSCWFALMVCIRGICSGVTVMGETFTVHLMPKTFCTSGNVGMNLLIQIRKCRDSQISIRRLVLWYKCCVSIQGISHDVLAAPFTWRCVT